MEFLGWEVVSISIKFFFTYTPAFQKIHFLNENIILGNLNYYIL